MNNEISVEILEEYGVLSKNGSGWELILASVSWNGNDPKFDIRWWNADRTRCGKGIGMSIGELGALKEIIGKMQEKNLAAARRKNN